MDGLMQRDLGAGMLANESSRRAGGVTNFHVSAWIETSAVFVGLFWIMLWEWMHPLESGPATDFGERAWALRHEGHGSRATLPTTLRGKREAS